MVRKKRNSYQHYILTLFAFLMCFSCGEETTYNAIDCKCAFDKYENDSLSIFNNQECKSVEGVCYSMFKIADSVNIFFGRDEDTIYFIKASELNYKKPIKTAFIPISADTNLYYDYSDYIRYDDDLVLYEDAVEVGLKGKRVEGNDTIYIVSHTCRPSEIIEITKKDSVTIPKIERTFEFSLRRGVIDYTEKITPGYKKIQFHW